jgi:hypothetical protein
MSPCAYYCYEPQPERKMIRLILEIDLRGLRRLIMALVLYFSR